MRGTPRVLYTYGMRIGIIPAYAGNTQSMKSDIGRDGDHPRVCGEHLIINISVGVQWGSSPRMRGTPLLASIRLLEFGIIPAYAGNTSSTVVLST